MTRLEAEQQRLYLREPPEGMVTALVLEAAGPGAWTALVRAWQGVQAELELPAPGIAVNGTDGYQLWFSVSRPVPAARAVSFLEGLRKRYLADIAAARTRTAPPGAGGSRAGMLPPMQVAEGAWSAFVTVDLAAVFDDEPWLDMPPTPDAQAELLSRLQGMAPADFSRALERLLSADAPVAPAAGERAPQPGDPRSFLLGVMNDGAVDLKLRIEAAKALLPYFEHQRS